MKNVAAETPKTASASTTHPVTTTPVAERHYKLVAEPTLSFKGIQRQIVFNAIKEGNTSLSSIVKFATANGLRAVGGIEPSCKYHLGHLVKLGFIAVDQPAQSVAA